MKVVNPSNELLETENNIKALKNPQFARSFAVSCSLALCSYFRMDKIVMKALRTFAEHSSQHTTQQIVSCKKWEKKPIEYGSMCAGKRRRSSKTKRNLLSLDFPTIQVDREKSVHVTIVDVRPSIHFPGIHSFKQPNQFRRDAMIFHRFSHFRIAYAEWIYENWFCLWQCTLRYNWMRLARENYHINLWCVQFSGLFLTWIMLIGYLYYITPAKHVHIYTVIGRSWNYLVQILSSQLEICASVVTLYHEWSLMTDFPHFHHSWNISTASRYANVDRKTEAGNIECLF